MDYDYDVFLSYRRWREWPRWVKDVFIDIFEHWLGEELDWEPRVFVDYRDIEEGSWWDMELGFNLSRSRVLVPLFSRTYFRSDWCIAELALMRRREDENGYRTTRDRRILIVPAILHDGKQFPADAQRLQALELSPVAGVRIARGSPKYEALDDLVREWVPTVARAIEDAPVFDPRWEDLSVGQFDALFRAQTTRTTNPRFG